MVLIYHENPKGFKKAKKAAEAFQSNGKKVGYRNADLFDKPEKCEGVYIVGDYPEVEKAYDGVVIKKLPAKKKAKDVSAYPKQVGDSAWFELSNGEKIQGEEKAEAAQALITNS